MISLKRLPKFAASSLPSTGRSAQSRPTQLKLHPETVRKAVNAESFGRGKLPRAALTDAHLDFLRITLAQSHVCAPPVCTRWSKNVVTPLGRATAAGGCQIASEHTKPSFVSRPYRASRRKPIGPRSENSASDAPGAASPASC